MTRVRQRSFLVTGAAGFVGSCLVRRLLSENNETHILIKSDTDTWRIRDLLLHPSLRIHKVSLTQKSAVQKVIRETSPTVIYHLAARGAYSTQNNTEEILRTNILGTQHLLEACQNLPYELFVNTGSSSEYGLKETPMSESDREAPMSSYATSKVAATHLATYTAHTTHKPIVTLRLFSVFGPYEEPTRFFPKLLSALATNQPLSLVDQNIARDFIYVDDVVDLYLHIDQLQKHAGEIFNVGTGHQSTIGEVTQIAQGVTQRQLLIQESAFTPRSWDTTHWVADMTKTKKLLQWMPKNSVETGTKKMWQWLQSHREQYF